MLHTIFYELNPLFSENEELTILDVVEHSKHKWVSTEYTDSNYNVKFRLKRNTDTHSFSMIRKHQEIVSLVLEKFPNANIQSSYIIKIEPEGYIGKHVDKNRQTAVTIPIGSNKGEITFYCQDRTFTYQYSNPIIAKVDEFHSAQNRSSTLPRYALTIELPGSFEENVNKYNKYINKCYNVDIQHF